MSQILPWFTMIQRNMQEMNAQNQNKTQNTLTENERQVAQQAIHGFPSSVPFCDRQTSAVLELCVFLYVSSSCNKGSHTFLSVAPTLSSLSPGEPRLLLSSSLSKLNNHEEKNITCGEFAPFPFASHYPNSALILYHHYPPANDRVGARLSLPTYNTTHTTRKLQSLPSVWHSACVPGLPTSKWMRYGADVSHLPLVQAQPAMLQGREGLAGGP